MSTGAAETLAAGDAIAPALIAWHARHGRHDLPWQRDRSPYRVWVSEIMLQQTQVASVIGYYERFMRRFPDVATLAAAPIDEVLHAWSGLGYYARARNLQRAARCIVEEHGGQLPEDPRQLERLPGVGRSTAAAIVALALDRRATICDGNVRRVLARCFGIDGDPGRAEVQRRLWQQAEACTPSEAVAVYTQAIMDLGATLCVRRSPHCERCPLAGQCVAHRHRRTDELPAPRRRRPRPQRSVVMLFLRRGDGCVLLRRRPARGVWASLWGPLEFADVEAAHRYCVRAWGNAGEQPPRLTPLPSLRHAFTHFDLIITPLRADCVAPQAIADGVTEPSPVAAALMEGVDGVWYNPSEPARIGLPAPVRTLLAALCSPPAAEEH